MLYCYPIVFTYFPTVYQDPKITMSNISDSKAAKVEQFKPEEANGLEDFLDNVSNAAKQEITSKNNLGILITHVIEGEKISSKKASVLALGYQIVLA